jgi:DNA-binding NarL/FixJ family response regulator
MIVSLVLQPDGTLVKVELRLATGHARTVRLSVPYRSSKAEGLEGMTRGELQMANYLLRGMSVAEIASAKNTKTDTVVHEYVKRVCKRAGTDDPYQAALRAEPYIQARRSELGMSVYRKDDRNEPFGPLHTNLLELEAAGYAIKDVAEMLGLDAKQADFRRRQARWLLGTRTMAAAIAKARSRGLIRDFSGCERPADEDIEMIGKLAAGASYGLVAAEHALSVDELLSRLADLRGHCGVARNHQLFDFARERGWISP